MIVPDEILVERTAAGDEQAFAALFDRHEPILRARLRRILSARIRHKVAISDILQEARLAVYQACGSFRPGGLGSVRAWLCRIAELKAYEAVRRFTGVAKRDMAREATSGVRPDTDQFVDGGPSPSEAAIAVELQVSVQGALARLSDDHRQVLHLVSVKGLTFAEAGSQLNRSSEAVRKLYGRALSLFTQALGEERGESDDG